MYPFFWRMPALSLTISSINPGTHRRRRIRRHVCPLCPRGYVAGGLPDAGQLEQPAPSAAVIRPLCLYAHHNEDLLILAGPVREQHPAREHPFRPGQRDGQRNLRRRAAKGLCEAEPDGSLTPGVGPGVPQVIVHFSSSPLNSAATILSLEERITCERIGAHM